jgi:hypothetical protein
LSIPGILGIIILACSCHGSTVLSSFNSYEVSAVAFPADLPQTELENVFRKHGIESIVNESKVLVPMTDFVRLQYLSLSDFSRRVQVDDPRTTPLSLLLASSFTASAADGLWRVWYVPLPSTKVYKAIQTAFLEIGSDWAWDAQLPSPVLRFLWLVWLAWILWLLVTKQVKDRLYHGVLIIAWLPLAFFHTLPAAALMVVGQGLSVILGMNVLANIPRKGLSRIHLRSLFADLVPFLFSMVFLLSIDMRLLIPTVGSIVMIMLLIVYRDPVLAFLTKNRMHRSPPFRLILGETIRVKAARIGLLALVPLALLAIILLMVPFDPVEASTYRLLFKVDTDQSFFTTDYLDLIRSHTRYQEALALGRLGDARWMSETYSRPFHFEIQDNRIVKGEIDHGNSVESFKSSTELERGMMLVLGHTQGGIPMVVSGDDIPGIRAIQLDSQGVVFYIMAMASFCVLGLHRVSQSRRRTRISYTNRQVA